MTAAKVPDHSDRIASLEANYKSMGREIAGIRDDQAAGFAEIRRELHAINNNNRTQFGPIISGVGVVVTILGGLILLGASGPLREIDRHTGQLDRVLDTRFTKDDGRGLKEEMLRTTAALTAGIERLMERQLAHESDGHPEKLEEMVRALSYRLEMLERRVEVHHQDGHPHKVEERVKGLDSRLQLLELAHPRKPVE